MDVPSIKSNGHLIEFNEILENNKSANVLLKSVYELLHINDQTKKDTHTDAIFLLVKKAIEQLEAV